MKNFTIILLLFISFAIQSVDKSNASVAKIEQLQKTISELENSLIQIVKEEEKNYQWINELQETLISLKKKKQENINSLKYQQQKLTKLLRAFKTLSTNTSLMVFVSCKSREDVIYTSIILDKTISHLKEIALDLRQELSEIENSKEQISFAEENLAQGMKALHQKKNAVESQLKVSNQKLKELVQTLPKEIEGKIALPSNVNNLITSKTANNVIPTSIKKDSEFSWPLKGRVVGTYTYYPDFLLKGKGIIVEVKKTAPVFCPQEGLVTKIIENVSVGYTVIITHAQGYQTILAGIDVLHCYQGQNLQKEQIVGIVEGTLLKHPQLCIQLKRYGRWENPVLFYSKE